MANDIGNYFKSEPDREDAVAGVFNHLNRFWEIRMQKQIVDYLEKGGDKLDPVVADAVARLKSSITEVE
jgi:formate dehydrogenase subunit delta